MNEDDQNNTENQPDISLHYDCVSDLRFSSMDFEKLIDGICIGFSTFSIRSNNKNNFIWYTYNKNIGKMKIKYMILWFLKYWIDHYPQYQHSFYFMCI
jgi:hypothetical protein